MRTLRLIASAVAYALVARIAYVVADALGEPPTHLDGWSDRTH